MGQRLPEKSGVMEMGTAYAYLFNTLLMDTLESFSRFNIARSRIILLGISVLSVFVVCVVDGRCLVLGSNPGRALRAGADGVDELRSYLDISFLARFGS